MALNWSECIICQDSDVNEPLRCPKATNVFGSSEDKVKKSYDKFLANIQRLRDEGVNFPPEFKFPEGITAQTLYDNSGIPFSSSDIQFLDASSHLCKRVCRSVGRSVRWSVGPSVRNPFLKKVNSSKF